MKKIEKAQKIKKDLTVIENENKIISEQLVHELDTNLDFSLSVDPYNKYNMSYEQKTFIRNYVDYKNISIAADLTGIDINTAKSYFVAYSSQQEIRRINRAMYQRQFSHKLLSIDEIGGYLSSLITEENIAEADKIKSMDKVKVAQMIIDLQKYKNEAIHHPENIIDVDIETEIKDLSIKSIKTLIAQAETKNNKDKAELIEKSDVTLSPEEEAFLKTLPYKDILKLINEKEDK